jgi:hypothetical protein
MKMVFVVCPEIYTPASPLMELLSRLGIDFFTRWDHVKGKGHGTMAHLASPSFPAENSVLMIALQDDGRLPELIEGIVRLNERAARPDEQVRLFQLPLERCI